MRIPNVLLALIAWTILALGCETTPDTGAEYGGQTQDTAILTPQERTERREDLSREWRELRAKIDELRARTDVDGIENEWDETVAKIDREAEDLSRQLQEFTDDGREAWNAFEARVQSALETIEREIDETVEKMG